MLLMLQKVVRDQKTILMAIGDSLAYMPIIYLLCNNIIMFFSYFGVFHLWFSLASLMRIPHFASSNFSFLSLFIMKAKAVVICKAEIHKRKKNSLCIAHLVSEKRIIALFIRAELSHHSHSHTQFMTRITHYALPLRCSLIHIRQLHSGFVQGKSSPFSAILARQLFDFPLVSQFLIVFFKDGAQLSDRHRQQKGKFDYGVQQLKFCNSPLVCTWSINSWPLCSHGQIQQHRWILSGMANWFYNLVLFQKLPTLARGLYARKLLHHFNMSHQQLIENGHILKMLSLVCFGRKLTRFWWNGSSEKWRLYVKWYTCFHLSNSFLSYQHLGKQDS